ncbi:MAG: hypothetical protein J6D42_08435 [Clostridia bacterium]|nr:hypothetical protein [Clostridia bacterium]
MLYKKNKNETLSQELFLNPTEEYRGAPFWAWNCKVTPDLIKRQIGYLKEMGFGGYHIHSRTGMDVPYLSDEFMDLIKVCAEEAKKTNTLAWLYDEDRWPSGAAGGLVTKNPKYRARYIRMSRQDKRNEIPDKQTAIETGDTYLFRVYDIVLNDKGELVSYDIIDADAEAKGNKWFAYIDVNRPSGWYNYQTYVDTISKEAINCFINTTHERYKEAVGKDFDGVVPAIFTDEPQVSRKGYLSFAKSESDVTMPWTIGLEDLYKENFGEALDIHIPELFWELPDGKISVNRYRFHDYVCQLFTEAFADNCGEWCEKNGISMTGHMMEEPTLRSQTAAIGEAMRSYRKFQLPGIDMLCDGHEYTTAKQAQSASHQYGREGVLSELYGVTGWDFDFRGHKHQGDWQAALGVTVRVPHLSWMSMYGEAKRDYPASIFYQSAWYKEYPYIENHYARINTALTRGRPKVDIAVIHPIESYWLHWGPAENTDSIRSQMERNFSSTIEWLLFAQLDFDYISESLLPEQFGGAENAEMTVGKMKYKAVVVPAMETIRSTTLSALEKFKAAGGTVIFMGDCPKYVDAVESDAPKKLFAESVNIGISKDELVGALEDFRNVEIREASGNISDRHIYNYRKDNDCDWLFICNGRPADQYGGFHQSKQCKIKIKGEFTPMIYDTLLGTVTVADYSVENGWTTVNKDFYTYDSLLLKLLPYDRSVIANMPEAKKKIGSHYCKKLVNYNLSEQNVFLIDCADWRVDSKDLLSDEPWQENEEILKICIKATEMAGIPKYTGAQPWVEPQEILSHYVDLKVVFNSDIEYEGAYLAIENAPLCEIILNGEKAGKDIYGYFVDESIEKIALPKIVMGENTLLIRTPIGVRTKVEWCYLLGEFGVKVIGCEKSINALPEKLGYSSIVHQNLPFYTGNIEYTEQIETPECELTVKISEYKGALIRVFLDGEDKGVIAFDPYRLNLGRVSAGTHTLTYKLFGTRFNAFGAVHNCNTVGKWYGPGHWHEGGDSWCYEYKLKDQGILASPIVEMFE